MIGRTPLLVLMLVSASVLAADYDILFQQGMDRFEDSYWYLDNATKKLKFCRLGSDSTNCTATYTWGESASYRFVVRSMRAAPGGRRGDHCQLYGGTPTVDDQVFLFDSSTGMYRQCELGCRKDRSFDYSKIQCFGPFKP
jgi:hypothetical protein